MNLFLIKLLATALAIGQATTRPDAVRTEFDSVNEQQEVVQILRESCAHMRKTFDLESIDIDDLLETALSDPKAVDARTFRGIDLGEVQTAYKAFCSRGAAQPSAIDVGELISFYNQAAQDLPEVNFLKGLKLPVMSEVLDGKGGRFAELYQPENRRVWVSLNDVPVGVRRAFVAAEDRHFYEHKGIDERGVIRAFIGNMASPGRSQGGSTITQQVVKNLLVGNEVSYERKIREILSANKVEKLLSKDEILELYLNTIFLGRSSWGIEMAARSYFGKSAKELGIAEGAMLAGLVRGPNYYSPDRHPQRVQERLAYVLTRMQADGAVNEETAVEGAAHLPKLIPLKSARGDSGFHFIDHLSREARASANIASLNSTSSYRIRSTIQPDIQRAAESALQEGLARYELNSGRVNWQGPEGNLADRVKRIEALQTETSTKPAWLTALQKVRAPLYDVHWPIAVVVEKTTSKNGDEIKVGLRDGQIARLYVSRPSIKRSLKMHDLVYVALSGGKAARAELRFRPKVQGSAIVLDNKTGKVLAMVGGFSYPLSQHNRATQSSRQPGSALKPLTYLAALAAGLQPNTVISDAPITLPPPGGANRHTPAKDYWTPKNYDGGNSGSLTLRRALENSRNLVTARLLDGGISAQPEASLDKVCALAKETRIYTECMRYYPFVLGAQPVRPIDLASFYAAVANEGGRPTPYTIESIEQDGKTVYQHEPKPLAFSTSADRVAFYQLKTMLQGVLSRGTARRVANLAPYVGGKTGTSDEENDTWFVGFSNDVTVAIWVGYDNADGKRRTLGGRATGGSVAVPIFAPIMQAAWTYYAPRTALAPASKEAMRNMVAKRSGDFTEYFRTDKAGRITVVKTRLATGESPDVAKIRRVRRTQPNEVAGYDSYGQFRYHQSWNFGWGQERHNRRQAIPESGSFWNGNR